MQCRPRPCGDCLRGRRPATAGEVEEVEEVGGAGQEAGWEARWDFGKTRARLAWIQAIRLVYAAALELVGVTAPEQMHRPAAEAETDGSD